MTYVDPSQQTQNAQPQQPAEYNVSVSKAEDAYKRSGLTKDKLLARYKMRLESAKKYRKDECYDDTWKRMRDMYRGRVYTDGLNDEDRIAVNIAFSTVNVIVPSIAVNYPTIAVTARQPQMEQNAANVQAMINYWWRHYDWRNVSKDIAKDSLVYGHGWAKVGWHYEGRTRPLTEAEQAQQFEEMNQQVSDAAAANPEAAADLPTPEDIQASLPTTTEEAVKDCPFFERVSPFDMLVDCEAIDTTDWKWVAQKIVRPLEQAQKDGSYNKAARDKLTPDSSTNPRYRDEEPSKKYDDDVKRVTIWEFYDLDNKMYCAFAEHGDKFLIEPTDYPYPYGVPFVYLGNYSVPDQFYDLGDLEMIEPLQAELNALRTQMHNYRKGYQRAYVGLRDKFSDEAMAQLADDKDGRVVWIEGDEDVNALLAPLPQQAADPNFYNMSEVIEHDIEQVTGVSDYMRGSVAEGRRTATEASIIQDSSNARAADKLAQIETWMSKVAARVTELAQAFLTGEDYAKVLGPDAAMTYVPFNAVAIEGEFDFEVEAGSTQPKNEQFKQQQAQMISQVVGPFVGTVIDPNKYVTYLLREGFGMKNPEQLLIPPEVQMQQQMLAQQQQADAQAQEETKKGEAQTPPPGDEAENTDENGVPQNAQAAQLAGQLGLTTNNF